MRFAGSCLPCSTTAPPLKRCSPVSTSISSDWPLPSTPAMPKISPARISRLMSSSTLRLSRVSVAPRSAITTSCSPGAGCFSVSSDTMRPTISSASCA